MAENIPNLPGGAVPPKKETGKVQPKKETVRINLPPKPTTAPTIKLPTLPPGGPAGTGAAAPAPTAAPAPHAPPTSATSRPTVAAPIAHRPGPPLTSARHAGPVVMAPTISGLDKGLAVGAMVVGLIAAGAVVYLAFLLPID
jgi:hypothetical protein